MNGAPGVVVEEAVGVGGGEVEVVGEVVEGLGHGDGGAYEVGFVGGAGDHVFFDE